MLKNCTISTPQHAPKPPHEGWLSDQEWMYNKEKKCYETFFTQDGTIDTETWMFSPDPQIRGGHKVLFSDEATFNKFVLNV